MERDRQTNRRAERLTDRQGEGKSQAKIHREREWWWIDIYTDRWAEKQTKTHREGERQAEMHRESQNYKQTNTSKMYSLMKSTDER